jgi:hypothetical protein
MKNTLLLPIGYGLSCALHALGMSFYFIFIFDQVLEFAEYLLSSKSPWTLADKGENPIAFDC